ncbi:S41 family peptidase [Dethiosulfatarculus sandiegensis]|uniref:Peptidase S41 n=1 Tax=Dethiosulfatarculus sandiegensis TaxID=1429043 RepID=A0A0D2JUZ6_9BACT|nr:S41 family peptidase [Dethiosulfatarculus sandiegensis]KIX13370.1 peptidase S41 [Dethiosulfatarculus sandiegensis]
MQKGRLSVLKTPLAILFFSVVAAACVIGFSRNLPAQAASDAEYRRMRVFTEALAEIERKYVEKKSPEELINAAIKGMVSSLDPHSSYLTPEEYKELQVETKGSFTGVGIEITTKDGILTVVSPIEGTPAYKAGIKAGDRIVKIDGKLTKGMTSMDAVKAIRGPKGDKVVLSIMREGEARLLDIPIVRDVIPLVSVRHKIIEDGYGYVRISTFQENTTSDLVKALRNLQTQKIPLKGLVLDLRNDPGGLLQEAVGVADQFLEDGVIVSTKGRLPGQEMVFRATGSMTAGDYPIVCLVNNGTASASEIVAGALQDHSRAIIMGTTSFGKGSVQTIIPMDDNGALRLTTARYYVPSGRAIQAKGIVPDVVVAFEPPPEKPNKKEKFHGIREKDLNGAMKAEEDPEAENKNKDEEETDDKLYMTAERLAKDNQLRRALDLLKAWQVFEKVAKTKYSHGATTEER